MEGERIRSERDGVNENERIFLLYFLLSEYRETNEFLRDAILKNNKQYSIDMMCQVNRRIFWQS